MYKYVSDGFKSRKSVNYTIMECNVLSTVFLLFSLVLFLVLPPSSFCAPLSYPLWLFSWPAFIFNFFPLFLIIHICFLSWLPKGFLETSCRNMIYEEYSIKHFHKGWNINVHKIVNYKSNICLYCIIREGATGGDPFKSWWGWEDQRSQATSPDQSSFSSQCQLIKFKVCQSVYVWCMVYARLCTTSNLFQGIHVKQTPDKYTLTIWESRVNCFGAPVYQTPVRAEPWARLILRVQQIQINC